MPSEVLFAPFRAAGPREGLNRRITEMLERTGFFEQLRKGDRAAVKVHPGERNNLTYLRPSFARSVVEELVQRGASPFVIETTTLYCRQRFTAGELLSTAAWNGYSEATLGCPFVVADTGPDEEVEVRGERLETVGVAREVADSDALLVLTHPTGHLWTAGLAGTVKNLGMGCVGRATKADIHLSTTITIDQALCDACGDCMLICKSEAIEMTGDCAVLTDACVRCGVCIGSCPRGAIGFYHDHERFARSLAEAAVCVFSLFERGRIVFVNVLLDVTWHCDCEDFSDRPAFPDLGVLVSLDPVAIDRASADLINSSTPVEGSKADTRAVTEIDDKLFALSNIEWWKQLEYAEALSLGTNDYELVEIDL